MNNDKLIQRIDELEQKIENMEKSRRGAVRDFLKKSFSKTSVLVGIFITAVISSIIVYAAQVTFTDGTVISADDVNNNFTELYTKVNELDASVTSIQNSGGANLRFPDGLDGTVVNFSLRSGVSTYTVPDGKTLYITSGYDRDNIEIGGVKYGHTLESQVMVFPSGTVLTGDSTNYYGYTGLLFDSNTEVVNFSLRSGGLARFFRTHG